MKCTAPNTYSQQKYENEYINALAKELIVHGKVIHCATDRILICLTFDVTTHLMSSGKMYIYGTACVAKHGKITHRDKITLYN